MKITKNNFVESNTNNNTNIYPTFDEDNNTKSYFSSTFNPNLNNNNKNTNSNNYYPNQTKSFNSNNISINPFGNSFNNSNSNNYNPTPSISTIDRTTPSDYGSSRGNNTIGYLSYRKENSSFNSKPFSISKQDDDDDDRRFHELSITKNFSRFNKSNPYSLQ